MLSIGQSGIGVGWQSLLSDNNIFLEICHAMLRENSEQSSFLMEIQRNVKELFTQSEYISELEQAAHTACDQCGHFVRIEDILIQNSFTFIFILLVML
jgi:hypothetical protein